MPNKKIPKELLMKATRGFKVLDFRAASQTVTVDGTEKTQSMLIGHAAVFDTVANIGGWFNEIIERGAFDGCDFSDVLFCVNHDTRKIPLARSRRNNGNSTMKLSIDPVGLLAEASVDTENNAEARSLYSAVDRGDIDGMSMIFQVEEDSWAGLDTDMPTRRVKKISKVYETGAVNWPAYESTDINARDNGALESARLALENARSQALESAKAVDILRLKNKIKGGI